MIRKGLAVAVILLFIGVAFTSSINANVSKSSVEPIADVDVKDDVATPIVLVFQLINKLRNHKDIQNIETEDDVLQIIESDEELNSIVERLSGDDCGCEDDSSTLEWKFPGICFILYPVFLIAILVYLQTLNQFLLDFVGLIGITLDCFWTHL